MPCKSIKLLVTYASPKESMGFKDFCSRGYRSLPKSHAFILPQSQNLDFTWGVNTMS